MQVDPTTLKAWRVGAQNLRAPHSSHPADVVQSLAGVQAQDYRWAKWSISLRTEQPDERAVDNAIESREIVRTWMFRGTLHFVASADLAWLTALLAPGIIRRNARRYRQLSLDDAVFSSSQVVIQRALEEHGALTRGEIIAFLEQEGVPAQGQQVPYLLQRAALDGLICHGLPRGSEPEYVLLSGWADTGPMLEEQDALGRLATLYFAGHGPATRQDFAWWAGLTAAETRRALEAAADIEPVQAGEVEYWAVGDLPLVTAEGSSELLPRFDEYLLGYKDRSLVLDPAYARRVNAGGGMPRPTVMVDGDIVGTWDYDANKQQIDVSMDPFEPLAAHQRTSFEHAITRLARHTSLPVNFHT